MLQSLPELQRIDMSLEQLSKQKQALEQLKTKSNNYKGKVQKQLSYSIQDRINEAKKKLALCEKLEKDIENEQFINAEFLVEDLVYDIKQLPDWFSFVFQKQFDKQRNSFAALAKKLYKQHCLHEKKIELSTEINSFQTLNNRYKSLSQSDINCININSEAQTFENRCKIILDRFINYIELVGKKVMQFVQQNVQKSLNYRQKVTNFGNNSDGYAIFSQNNELNRGQQRDYKSVNKDRFRSTMPGNTSVSDLNERPQSSNKCINHNYYHSHNYQHQSNGVCPSHFHGHNYRRGRQIYTDGVYQNIPTMNTVGYGESRFNYRDHMPKYTSKTLSNFYY